MTWYGIEIKLRFWSFINRFEMDEKRARVGKKVISFFANEFFHICGAFLVCVQTAGNIKAKDKKQQQKKSEVWNFLGQLIDILVMTFSSSNIPRVNRATRLSFKLYLFHTCCREFCFEEFESFSLERVLKKIMKTMW